MPSERTQPQIHKLGRNLLLGLFVALAALAMLESGAVQRLDNLFYDVMVRVHERPANDQILIVAIDDKSLRELGRWPWSRRVHADMVDKLTALDAAAVGIDILFSERDFSDPDSDALLAAAIEQNGRVVLVVGLEDADGQLGNLVSEVLPLPDLAASAALLAHIDFEMDADGICRRVFLRAGLGNAHWPAMGLALQQIAHPELQLTGPETGITVPFGTGWVREQPLLISYTGPPGHIRRLSYVDVLKGRVPAEQLRNRIVMIGATAIGLGDTLSTPLSTAHTLMPGIEVNANLVASLLDQSLLREASSTWRSVILLLSILFLLLWLVLLPRRLALAGLLLSLALTLAISLALLALRGVWHPPAISLLLQTILYILWSWLDVDQLSRQSLQLRSQMNTQARSDKLTGLPNRQKLQERLDEIQIAAQSGPTEFALLIISVRRHRSLLSLTGIKGNDNLLRQIATRISKILPGEDSVYRLEGAEFAVLIDQTGSTSHSEATAARLVQSLLRPFQLGTNQFSLSPSIGASLFPQDGRMAQQLIDHAYTAMHRAREDRLRRFFFFSPQIKADIIKESRLNQELRRPSWQDELSCVYQPQVDVATGRLVGVETLVRWHHPQIGQISPAEFIPLAEREGLIVPIGSWILREACNQGQLWRETYGWNLRMAVNVSAIQLNSPGLIDVVRNALTASGLPPSSLELELTETAVLTDQEATLATLVTLKGLNIALAIDDFGTGYSSLSYLKNLPVDRVKIDQSFIMDMHHSNESVAITRSIINMTSGLDLEVIAEGVEQREHLDLLRELGCDEAQGYLIGKPMEPSDLENAINSGQLQVAFKSTDK